MKVANINDVNNVAKILQLHVSSVSEWFIKSATNTINCTQINYPLKIFFKLPHLHCTESPGLDMIPGI